MTEAEYAVGDRVEKHTGDYRLEGEVDECLRAETGGLIEKCRDMGATWTCAAFSVWLFIFKKGVTVGWGSRKEELVDHLGDMNSIFEKMRTILRNLPNVFQPGGWSEECMSYMRIVNPEHGATIIGESGDNIGRGGRSRIYFVDEAAHVEHPEMIEASLSENTRVKIDLSSVNGPNNVFHRRRENGIEWEPGEGVSRTKANVFVMDWRDHPLKDQAWYDAKRAKAIDDGLLHVFKQEIERDYFGALTGTVIPQEWVISAIDAHIKLKLPKMEEGPWTAALDVADGGTDVNALVKRKGVVLQSAETWGERDTGVTTRRTVMACSEHGRIQVQYDCIGVGSGIKAESNRLKDEKLLPKGMRFVPWDAGAGPNNPDGHVVPNDRDTPLNKDFYQNMDEKLMPKGIQFVPWDAGAGPQYPDKHVIENDRDGCSANTPLPEPVLSEARVKRCWSIWLSSIYLLLSREPRRLEKKNQRGR